MHLPGSPAGRALPGNFLRRLGLSREPDSEPAMAPEILAGRLNCPSKVSSKDYGVYHFHKSVDVFAKAGRFVMHLTTDNRYPFFVNGRYT